MKSFLITVDTEGDNLWDWYKDKCVTTNNASYIPRFQELCEKYNYKPVYLTNYEMCMKDSWVEYANKKAKNNLCEIGLHIHAWNTPPYYELKQNFGGNPYITEYPIEIIEQKICTMMELLQSRFDADIVTHRAGRWATSNEYFKLLSKYGIKYDCSITPQLNLSNISGYSQNCGNDYRNEMITPHFINEEIIEVPMTTRFLHSFTYGSFKHKIKSLILGEEMWLRPIRKSLRYLEYLSEKVEKDDCDYLEFMIHSSELMPGGSKYFKNENEINELFAVMEKYFQFISRKGYQGETIKEYGKRWKDEYYKKNQKQNFRKL